ncbi:hypothetical protein J6590_079900 [Homalodisca vitripennis]|nr:hypothetical protein J6590_079900 [Homalodisca vitripennis]
MKFQEWRSERYRIRVCTRVSAANRNTEVSMVNHGPEEEKAVDRNQSDMYAGLVSVMLSRSPVCHGVYKRINQRTQRVQFIDMTFSHACS